MPPRVLEGGQTPGGTHRVIRKIAEGGMGVVYEAAHERLPTRFAIKLMSRPAEGPNAAVVLERFKREAQVAAKLKSPHVVQIHDYQIAEGGFPYIVMELLEGEDLGQLLDREGALPPARALAILEQIASAIDAAHAAGVIHRDLKPANVFLNRYPKPDHVKVLDFGVSRMQELATITRTDALIGTPLYMSPEQAGTGAEITAAADVFAFGVIAYETLTGNRPFGGKSIPAILYQVVHAAPTPVSASLGPTAADVDAVFAQVLAKEPSLRYPSTGDVVRALRVALEPLLSTLGHAGRASLSAEPTVVRREPRGPREEPPAYDPTRPHALLAATPQSATAVGMRGELQLRSTQSSRSARTWATIAVAMTIAATATGMWFGHGRSHAAPESMMPARAESAPAAAHEDVRVAVKVSPPGAEMTLDGRPVQGGAITVPWQSRPRELRVEAPGFGSVTQAVDASRDRELEITLEPAPASIVEATDPSAVPPARAASRRSRGASSRRDPPAAHAATKPARAPTPAGADGLVQDL